MPPAQVYFADTDRQEILSRMDEVLSTGQLTLGKYGRELEEQFCRRVGSRYAVAVNSGTSAIEIAMRVLGVEGKDVLVPTNTFFATPAAVLHAGGNVRFVDVDPDTFAMDFDALRRAVTPNTVGVIVVHIAGIITPRLTDICDWCHERGLFVFEDAAHAHGSALNGQPAGTFGDAASFSFYPTKVITAAEGGMIVTDLKHIRDEALLYRDQGKASFTTNVHTRLGYNWRLSEPHAIIGLSQLKRLDEFIAARRAIARFYDERLRDLPGVTPLPIPVNCRSNYYKYICLLAPHINRAALKQTLRERYGVGLSGEVYELPCHQQPVFQQLCGLPPPLLGKEGGSRHSPPYQGGAGGGSPFPVAEDICRRHICLPISARMTVKEAAYVVDALLEAVASSQ
ncbi:MAG: DegT/DnrJ/EryC1/StrS family aminotransferase [Abditibacteriales bacterium]|nr:DegT/DnrJ/EryC1/StrS family aminotransferase [Abditibacteriales bacterium]